MGVKRIVDTDFWHDEKVIDIYSPEDKYFWLYLLTNPQSKQLGIYKLPKKIIAFETGYSVDTVKVLIDRFQNKYNSIIYSDETQEIAILNYLKYSIIKGGKPVIDCIIKDIKQVSNQSLLTEVYKHTFKLTDDRETFKQIQELLSVYSNDNDNDNDNDSNVPRFEVRNVETKENEQKKKKEKAVPLKHKYGEYKNVLLSDEQLEKLKKEFPTDWEKRIENVSEYCESKGITYSNYLATIKSWAKKEKQKQEQQQIQQKKPNKFHNFIQGDKLSEEELEEIGKKKLAKFRGK